MQMHFEERPYAGKTFRPRPEIHLDQRTKLLIVATPWGARSCAKKVIERMTDFLSLANEDHEATSPFERLSCLSGQANNLRIATLLANEALYREDNTQEYRSGVELFAAMIDENELVWVQAGNPHILVGRIGRSLLPIGSSVDLSFDMSEGEALLPPLPSQLLGLDASINLNMNSFKARNGDRVLLLSYSHIPETIFAVKHQDIALDGVAKILAQDRPDLAFWLGLLTVAEDSNAEAETRTE